MFIICFYKCSVKNMFLRITILAFSLFKVIFSAEAQQKQGKVWATSSSRIGLTDRETIDYTNMRFFYAFNAESLSDIDSYIDLGVLQIGDRLSKYSSAFLAHSDSLLVEWHKKHPNAQAWPKYIELQGRMGGFWSEYQYSELFVDGTKLTEWALMPRFQEKECARYSEPYPLMKWTLGKEIMEICGHKCQKATCHFRGRDFIAWFAPDIPIRKGPWKFGGLPGLIMKVYDKDNLYTFECVRIEKGKYPITQYPEKYFPIKSRVLVYKLQIKMNENWDDLSGVTMTNRKDFYEYEPLELE